jgi:hypothetical protein
MVACKIGSYSDAGGRVKVTGLLYLPYGPAFSYTPLNMLYIYWKIRAQSRKSDWWRILDVQLEFLFSTNSNEANNDNEESSSERIPTTTQQSKLQSVFIDPYH